MSDITFLVALTFPVSLFSQSRVTYFESCIKVVFTLNGGLAFLSTLI